MIDIYITSIAIEYWTTQSMLKTFGGFIFLVSRYFFVIQKLLIQHCDVQLPEVSNSYTFKIHILI